MRIARCGPCYELLSGAPPFGEANSDAMATYKAILRNKVAYPKRIPKAPRDLIERLLVADPSQRLGASDRGAEQVAQHSFLSSLSAAAIERREVRPPRVPATDGPTDLRQWKNLASVPADEASSMAPAAAAVPAALPVVSSLFQKLTGTEVVLKNHEKWEYELLAKAFRSSAAAVDLVSDRKLSA